MEGGELAEELTELSLAKRQSEGPSHDLRTDLRQRLAAAQPAPEHLNTRATVAEPETDAHRQISAESCTSPLLHHLRVTNARLGKYLASDEVEALTEEQQIFIGLAVKTKAEAHLDFPQLFSDKWRDDLPRQVVGLYNGLGGRRYPGVKADGEAHSRGSSFLVYGVHEVNGGSGRVFRPVPDESSIPQSKDITDTMSNTQPRLITNLYKVAFGCDICLDACFEDPMRTATLRKGWYAFVEVKHTKYGPAKYKKRTRDGEEWAVAARSDDRTLVEEELRARGSMPQLFDLFRFRLTVESVDDLGPVLCATRDRIKILAVNPAAEEDAQSGPALTSLFSALGRADFQLLVNFGPSDSPAIKAFVAGIHATNRDCYQMPWQHLEKDTGRVCNEVRNRQLCVVVEGSGAPVEKGPLLRVWGKLTSQLFDAGSPGGLQLGLFVACLSQPNNLHERRCVQMDERLQESFEGLPLPADPASAPLTLLLSTEASKAFQTKLRDDAEELGWEGCSASPQQLALAFQRAFGSSADQPPGYVVRGHSGDVEIPAKLFASTESSVQLLHKTSGQGAFGTLPATRSTKERCLEDFRRDFLSGLPITTEALYAHDEVPSAGEMGVYAPRPRMETLKQFLERVMDRLERKEDLSSREKTLVLEHEPSAGATTLGRVVFWELRRRFPCLLVKRTLDSSVQRAVELIHQYTKSPMLLLLAGEHVSTKDAQAFHKSFYGAKLILLLIKPCYKLQESVATYVPEALLPLKLEPLENRNFRKLYKKYAAMNHQQLGPEGIENLENSAGRNEPTPFLWGLYSFFGDQAGIERRAMKILSHVRKSAVRDVLMLSSYLRLYAGRSFLSSQLANYYLGELPVSEDEVGLKERLGLAQYLLVSTRSERVWAEERGWGLTTPIAQLAHVLIRSLEEESGVASVSWVLRLLTQPDRDATLGHLVQGAIDEAVARLIRSRIFPGDRHCPLIEHVFRFRREEASKRAADATEKMERGQAEPTGSTETYTAAKASGQAKKIEQNADPVGVIEAVADLGALAEATSKGRSHVFANVARFICYSAEMETHSEEVLELLGKALEVIPRPEERRATEVDLRRTGVSDHIILSIAAFLLGIYADKALQGDFPARVRVGEVVSSLCDKARHEQRHRDHRTCHPYVHEINFLYKLQDFFFFNLCGGSSEVYWDGLRDSEGRVRSAAGERHSKLIVCVRDLECLNQSNLLSGETLRPKEARKLVVVKNWLRQIYLFHIADPRLAFIESADEKMVWAWMAVEVYLHREILKDRRRATTQARTATDMEMTDMEGDDSGSDSDQTADWVEGETPELTGLSIWSIAHLMHSRLSNSLAKDALRILNSAQGLLSRNRFERVMLQMRLHRWEATELEQAAEEAEAWASGAEDEVEPAFLVFALRFALALLLQPPPLDIQTAPQSLHFTAHQRQRSLHDQAKDRSRDSFFALQSLIQKNRRPGRRLEGVGRPRLVVEEAGSEDGRQRSFLRPLKPDGPAHCFADVHSPETRLFAAQRVSLQRPNTATVHSYEIQSQELYDATGWCLRKRTMPGPVGELGQLDVCVCLTYDGIRAFAKDSPSQSPTH